MAGKFLHFAQRHAALEQLGHKRSPEIMRTERTEAGLGAAAAQHFPDRVTGELPADAQPGAAGIDRREDRTRHAAAEGEIRSQQISDPACQGDQILAPSLAANAHALRQQILELKTDGLRSPQAEAIEEGDRGNIAAAGRGAIPLHGSDQIAQLLVGQHPAGRGRRSRAADGRDVENALVDVRGERSGTPRFAQHAAHVGQSDIDRARRVAEIHEGLAQREDVLVPHLTPGQGPRILPAGGEELRGAGQIGELHAAGIGAAQPGLRGADGMVGAGRDRFKGEGAAAGHGIRVAQIAKAQKVRMHENRPFRMMPIGCEEAPWLFQGGIPCGYPGDYKKPCRGTLRNGEGIHAQRGGGVHDQ